MSKMTQARFGLNDMGFSVTQCAHPKERFEARIRLEGTEGWGSPYQNLHISIDSSLRPLAEEAARAGLMIKFGCEDHPDGYVQLALLEGTNTSTFLEKGSDFSIAEIETAIAHLSRLAAQPQNIKSDDLALGSWFLNVTWIEIGFDVPSCHIVIWFPRSELNSVWGRLSRWNKEAR